MSKKKRSLIFNFISKHREPATVNFYQFHKKGPIDILNDLLAKYDPFEVEEIIIED